MRHELLVIIINFLNHHYFMRYEDEVELHKLDMLYEDLEPLTLKYELKRRKRRAV